MENVEYTLSVECSYSGCSFASSLCLLLAGGFRVIYDREVPFELRVQESADGPQQVGTLEAIKVKVLMMVRHSLGVVAAAIEWGTLMPNVCLRGVVHCVLKYML